MTVIKLEVPDKLAKRLLPYQDRLVELLELGLQKWEEHEPQDRQIKQEHLLQVLAASGKVTLPKPYTRNKPYIRHTPVPITGKPVSEIVIEQRGSL